MRRGQMLRLLLIVAAVFSLGLTGCGKKGDLSPPPSHADPSGAGDQDDAAFFPDSGDMTRG